VRYCDHRRGRARYVLFIEGQQASESMHLTQRF
jgi:hypothetical protein